MITANLLYRTALGENERKNEEARTEEEDWRYLSLEQKESRYNQLIRMDYFLLKHNMIMVLVGSYSERVFLSPAYMLGDYTACFLSEPSILSSQFNSASIQ